MSNLERHWEIIEHLEKIKATSANRKELRWHAKEAMKHQSDIMTWLCLTDDGNLYNDEEPQGQVTYYNSDTVLAMTGGFRKYYGDGAVVDCYGCEYRTQKDYLTDLLGKEQYGRIFGV